MRKNILKLDIPLCFRRIKEVKTDNITSFIVIIATCFDPKGSHHAKYLLKHITSYNCFYQIQICLAKQLYRLLCVLKSVQPDDDPVGSKHVAINTTNQFLLPVFTPLIKEKYFILLKIWLLPKLPPIVRPPKLVQLVT